MIEKKYIPYDMRLFQMLEVLLSLGIGLILANFLHINKLDDYLSLLLSVFFLQIFVFQTRYRSWRLTSISDHLKCILMDWSAITLVVIASLFLFKKAGDFSRIWFFSWILTVVICSIVVRLMLLFWLRRLRASGQNLIRIGLFCDDLMGDYVAKRIDAYPWSGYMIADVINIDSCYYETVDVSKFQEIWIALPMGREEQLKLILHQLRHHSIDIRYIPNMFGFRLINHSISHFMDMTFINLSSTPLDYQGAFLKRVEDILLSTFFLIAFSPMMLIIALLIKLTSNGPIFFKQKRNGWNGEEFYVYKFRSMYLHYEPDGQVTQATLSDKRITPIGRFLRRSSLDELPQFINVLNGTMSLVGPRPHAVEHNEQYKELVPKYMWRNKVKPGITGWAQINGLRGETKTLDDMKKRVDYDLFYIENWSILFDLKIIFITCYKIFDNKNVY